MARFSVFDPFVIVIHAVHPIDDPFRAALEKGNSKLGEFFKNSPADQTHQSRRAIQGPPQDMHREETIKLFSQVAVSIGMAEKGHIQFLRRLIVGIENRVVESARSQVRDEMSGFETQLLYAAPELVRHFIGTTCGRHGGGPEMIPIIFCKVCHPIVVRPAQGNAETADVARRNRNIGWKQDLSVDLLQGLVLKTSFQIPTAPLPF